MEAEEDDSEGNNMDVDEENEELGLLENYHVQLLTKALIDLEETEESNEKKFVFTKAIWSSISGSIFEMATKNRTAYVVSSLKEVQLLIQVREKLAFRESGLLAAAPSDDSSKSILSVVKLMNFSKGKKGRARVMKRKSAAKRDTQKQQSEDAPSRRVTRSTAAKKEKEEKPALRRSTRARKRLDLIDFSTPHYIFNYSRVRRITKRLVK